MWYPYDGEKLQTGDVIKTKSHTPLFFHYGVVLHENGRVLIAHNPYKGSIVVEPFESFGKDRPIYRVFRNEKTVALTDEKILQKVKELKNNPYDGLAHNCEDGVKDITGLTSKDIGMDDRWAWVAIFIVASLVILLLILYGKKLLK